MITYEEGEIIEGTVIAIRDYGAILVFENGQTGLLHISEVANAFIRNIHRYLKIGKTYQVKIIEKADDNFLKVSMSKITQEEKLAHKQLGDKRKPIDPDSIDFEALKTHLEEWKKLRY